MTQEERRRARNLPRAELIDLAKYCGMKGAEDDFSRPYRTRDWICANLPSSVFGSTSSRKPRRSQRGGQDPMIGAYQTLPIGARKSLYYCPTDPITAANVMYDDDPHYAEMLSKLSGSPLLVPSLASPMAPALAELVPPPIPTTKAKKSRGKAKQLPVVPTRPQFPPIPQGIVPIKPSPIKGPELTPGQKATQAAIASGAAGITSGELAGLSDEIARRARSKGLVPLIPYGDAPLTPPTPSSGPPLSEGALATLAAMNKTPGSPTALPIPIPAPRPKTGDEILRQIAEAKPLPAIPQKAKRERKIPITPYQILPPGPTLIPPAVPTIQTKTCPSGFIRDDLRDVCLEVAKTCEPIESCKLELKNLGLKESEAQGVLNQVKQDLIQCQSSSEGWKQIDADLRSMNLTKAEADRILVAIGNHVTARIKSGETLESILDNIQKTLDLAAATSAVTSLATGPRAGTTVAVISPPMAPPMPTGTNIKKAVAITPTPRSLSVPTPIGSQKPEAAELEAAASQLKKVTPQEKKSTRQGLESAFAKALLENPSFLARGEAYQGSSLDQPSSGEWDE